MHWVDRGDEPEALAAIRESYTPTWISRYRDGAGARPTDSRWREFRGALSQRFSGLCAYCEESCRGQVDHFRPKSRFPELVYEWTNWLYACPECNQAKRDQWPDMGYVDPCADAEPERPESYFDMDARNGHIIPRAGLSPLRHERAVTMIRHLKLNARHHIKTRLAWLDALEGLFPSDVDAHILTAESEARRRRFVSRATHLSSLSRAYLSERGYPTSG